MQGGDLVRVAVGAITRRRPEGLRRLLESFARMQRPEGAEIAFLLCENDDESRVAEVVDAFRGEVPEPVELMLEPRKGIPYARNRVLGAAMAQGFDFLTFVDDDEVVEPDWLVRMLEAMDARGLDLAAGPVLPVAPPEPLTGLQLMVLNQLRQRSQRRDVERARTVGVDDDGGVEAFTGNWCLRLAAARRTGVTSFDEQTAESGGEDSAFSLAMRRAGARIGWVPEAIAEETQPAMRLSLFYVYRRIRDQERNKMLLKDRSVAKRLWFVFQRSLEMLVVGAVLPVVVLSRPEKGRKLMFNATRKAGQIAGAFGSVFGLRSRHYAASADRLHVEQNPGSGEVVAK
ncbi:glycosyltransferase [Vannielia sp.]|uniref:glycosyltransferase n=1 Tax=Vannielia sp. TaxID=2813045 RepID=UPI003BAC1B9C